MAKLIREAYSLLKLQTYFTAGEKEVRAWTIREGFTAPQSAGVIHTDFEKGFIRAEVMKYADFVELGSEQAVKESGKLSVEGKEYVVEDGDIMHFRRVAVKLHLDLVRHHGRHVLGNTVGYSLR